jgi:uncharacterized protein YbbC (DUF1343 family)
MRRPTIDLLRAAPGDARRAVRSRHGMRGLADATVADSVDRETGCQFTAFAEPRGPTPSAGRWMRSSSTSRTSGVGSSYVSTMGLAMEAARQGAKSSTCSTVNPINGIAIESRASRHLDVRGLRPSVKAWHDRRRAGEDVQRRAGWGCELTVVPRGLVARPMARQHQPALDQPSPNMRNLTEAALYPGVGCRSAVSVGRGTDTPFEIVGALRERCPVRRRVEWDSVAGVRFRPHPSRRGRPVQDHPVAACPGVTDREALRAVDVGLALA